jgi:uncharacterized protein YndB with AHSA1/START domain
MTMPVLEQTDTMALVMIRRFAAPRTLLFRTWTEPEHARIWWAPQGFEIMSCQMDLQPGGRWRIRMRSPGGTIHVKRGRYREIVPPERLSFTWAWENALGETGPETIVTLSFDDQGSGTRLTLRQSMFPSEAARDEHQVGWSSCMNRFAEYILRA